jgi:hypothetical protein
VAAGRKIQPGGPRVHKHDGTVSNRGVRVTPRRGRKIPNFLSLLTVNRPSHYTHTGPGFVLYDAAALNRIQDGPRRHDLATVDVQRHNSDVKDANQIFSDHQRAQLKSRPVWVN